MRFYRIVFILFFFMELFIFCFFYFFQIARKIKFFIKWNFYLVFSPKSFFWQQDQKKLFRRVMFQFSAIVKFNKSFKLVVNNQFDSKTKRSISVLVQVVVLVYLEMKGYTTGSLVLVWGNAVFSSKTSFILVSVDDTKVAVGYGMT